MAARRRPAPAGRRTAERSCSGPTAPRRARHQLYRLTADAIGEAQRARPSTALPNSTRGRPTTGTGNMVVVAGFEAEQSDAVGSGTIAASDEMPASSAEVESTDRVRRHATASLHDRRRVGSGRSRRANRAERLGGELVRSRADRGHRFGRPRGGRVVRRAAPSSSTWRRDSTERSWKPTSSSAGSTVRWTAPGWRSSKRSAAIGSSSRASCCWWTRSTATSCGWRRRTSTWPDSG